MPPTVTRNRRSSPASYKLLAQRLRADIRRNHYANGRRLPTEAELSEQYGVSRQTVRRAFQDLVAEGMVYRVPGRGSFAYSEGKYLRSFGSIDDLMAISEDTDLEILEPPATRVSLEGAGRLQLDTDEVVTITFRRFHDDRAFCVTTAFLPLALGRHLLDVPELAAVGERQRLTVLSVVQSIAGTPIAEAQQSVTAVPAAPGVAGHIGMAPGEPTLRIDRLYLDRDRRLIELAVNHFNPARYSYRVQIRASPG